MNRVKVKICGITREEDLSLTIRLRPDALGFIIGVPNSPRNITIRTAEKFFEFIPSNIKSIIVTVSLNVDYLKTICERLRPHALQIHGESSLDSSILRKKLPSICLIRAVNGISDRVIETAKAASESFDAILIDSKINGKLGGTGIIHDWNMSRIVRNAILPKPLILAGGLTPENVGDAISNVKPYAVDVSSGVESSPGIKDPQKILSFIRNVRESLL